MKLGISLDNLGPSQLAYAVLSQANRLVTERSDVDVTVFYETLARPCITPRFAHMQMAEAYGFDGPVVATSLSSAGKLLRMPACPKKLFLVWDLEWLRKPHAYENLKTVYCHSELTLLARGEDHAKAISDCWNRPVAVVGDFDLTLVLNAACA
jgi:hypothetical protein